MKLNKIRIFVSALVFTLFIFIFFASSELALSISNVITQFQFIPGIIKLFINVFSVFSILFITILIITLLFGRVYCSFFCPLGIMQDIVISFRNIFKKKHKYIKPYNYVKFIILSLIILSLFSGSLIIINLTDPYSLFGRIITDLIKPVVLTLGNFFILILSKFKIYISANFSFHNPQGLTLAVTLIFFAFIIIFSLLKGRLYCNTICPVGTILGIISKFSFFKIILDKTSCTSCGICEKKCKAGCIDSKSKYIDFSRCIACYNCLDICPQNALTYKHSLNKTSAQIDSNRREFLKNFVSTAAGLLMITAIPLRSFAKQVLLKTKNLNPRIIAPPGALTIDNLTDLCTGCHLCISQCPTKVIKPAFIEYGPSGIMQPRMDYSKSFCDYECNRCTKICPTGALKPLTLEKKKLTQIGKVNLDFNKCIVFTQKSDCGACAEICPTGAVYMIGYQGSLKKPVTAANQCIGCGACEHVCPALPVKAIIVDGNMQHQVAGKPKVLNGQNNNSGDSIKNNKDVPEEFPF